MGDTTYRDTIINLPDCGFNPADMDTLRKIIRTWTFRDASGNSTECVQNIYELKTNKRLDSFSVSLSLSRIISLILIHNTILHIISKKMFNTSSSNLCLYNTSEPILLTLHQHYTQMSTIETE